MLIENLKKQAQIMLDFINTFTENKMKKYTLEQLKTKRVKIRVETEEIYTTLMQKFDEHNILWSDGQRATVHSVVCGNRTLINLYDAEGKLTYGYFTDGYDIITPDQIIWPKDEKAEPTQVTMRDNNDKTPAVFIKAQKDWNGFKAFLKEVEAYGRTLTDSQLKAYMAKERKLRGKLGALPEDCLNRLDEGGKKPTELNVALLNLYAAGQVISFLSKKLEDVKR